MVRKAKSKKNVPTFFIPTHFLNWKERGEWDDGDKYETLRRSIAELEDVSEVTMATLVTAENGVVTCLKVDVIVPAGMAIDSHKMADLVRAVDEACLSRFHAMMDPRTIRARQGIRR